MSLILGIDTGGTFTDAALIRAEDGVVVRTAKAPTTHHDLGRGIAAALARLEEPLQEVILVSLSTTLATNSIVEQKGGRVGLILIGKRPEGPFPALRVACIKGGHTGSGTELAELDPEELEEAWQSMADQVDSFAVSGYMSVRNPAHELQVGAYIRGKTSRPVVYAHQLSRELGFYERTVTAALNARILPVVNRLLDALQDTLKTAGISAPVMAVRGDGTLFSLEMAREYPLQTIFSGPAASIIGASYLSGAGAGTTVDMGGTTLDIGLIRKGILVSRREGVTAGGWRTKIKTAHSESAGLGGDSHIQYLRQHFVFGPRRVLPLAWGASVYPEIVREMEELLTGFFRASLYQPYDFFRAGSGRNGLELSESENRILEFAREAPRSVRQMADHLGIHPGLVGLKRLEGWGCLERISLTPSDLLHVKGIHTPWRREGADLALAILSSLSGIPAAELPDRLLAQFEYQIARSILVRLLGEAVSVPDWEESKTGVELLKMLLGEPGQAEIRFNLSMASPLIAVGAPVQAYLPGVARRLGAGLVIPPRAEAASAVGAAVAPVVRQAAVLVRPLQGGFSVHAEGEMVQCASLEEALSAAQELAAAEVKAYFGVQGLSAPSVEVEITKNTYGFGVSNTDDSALFIDAGVIAKGIGYPVADSARMKIVRFLY